MKIIKTIRFAGTYGFCGIVLGEDAITGERKAYIGIHVGQSEAADQRLIVEGGCHFTRDHAARIVKFFDKEEVNSVDREKFDDN